MSKTAWIVAGAVAVVAASTSLWLTRPGRPVDPTPVEGQPAAAPATSTRSAARLQPRQAGAPAVSASNASAVPTATTVDLPEAPAANPIRLGVDRVLATVNGSSIGLKDLVPLEFNERERAMTQEEYESRLERAIEVELTLQAAAAQGVVLTAEQQARVEALCKKQEASFEEYKKLGVTWGSGSPAQLAFERRMTTALLLQQNLVARSTPVAPSPDAALQARYEAARREILVNLRARGAVTVAGVR